MGEKKAKMMQPAIYNDGKENLPKSQIFAGFQAVFPDNTSDWY